MLSENKLILLLCISLFTLSGGFKTTFPRYNRVHDGAMTPKLEMTSSSASRGKALVQTAVVVGLGIAPLEFTQKCLAATLVCLRLTTIASTSF